MPVDSCSLKNVSLPSFLPPFPVTPQSCIDIYLILLRPFFQKENPTQAKSLTPELTLILRKTTQSGKTADPKRGKTLLPMIKNRKLDTSSEYDRLSFQQ